MQSDYRIEKNRVPVVVFTLSGERLEGDVFLQPYTQHRHGPEEVSDLLNADEPFFPMRCSNGSIRIVARDRVVEVELLVAPPDDDARPLAAREAMVELSLATGRRYTACVFYQVPTARPRLLDYLNGLDRSFVLLNADESWRLVNWRHIDCIRPLD
ncbi:MAG TPA: hypothetical protein VGE02_03260 [Gemmatimonadales bacterium]